MHKGMAVRFGGFVLCAAALLSACGGPPTLPKAPEVAPNQPVDSAPTLSGKLASSGAAQVSVNAEGVIIGTAAADASGTFTLNLPTKAALGTLQRPLAGGLFKDVGCAGTLNDGASQVQGVSFLTVTAGGQQYADATATRPGLLSRNLRGRAYLYADRSAALSGTLDCSNLTGLSTPVKVNINVQAGWSALTVNIYGSASISGVVTVEGVLQNGDKFSTVNDVWLSLENIKQTMGR